MPFSKEQLTPHGRRLFAAIKEKLPDEIAHRLRAQTKFTTHGNRKTVYVFDIWDGSQNGVLPRKYFKYCLAYDHAKLGGRKTDGYFHLWLSTVRIYRDRDTIMRYLERELPKVVPKGFKLKFVEDRAMSCGKDFNWPKDLDTLEELILDDYARLIAAIHPVLIPVIDQFSTGEFTSDDRRAEVKRRGRISITRKGGALDREKLRMYSRSIPPSWRAQILEKAKYRCQHCGANLTKKNAHIDHTIPFSRGGDTVLSNLQALCDDCNLAKGNRDEPPKRNKPKLKTVKPRRRKRPLSREEIQRPAVVSIDSGTTSADAAAVLPSPPHPAEAPLATPQTTEVPPIPEANPSLWGRVRSWLSNQRGAYAKSFRLSSGIFKLVQSTTPGTPSLGVRPELTTAISQISLAVFEPGKGAFREARPLVRGRRWHTEPPAFFPSEKRKS